MRTLATVLFALLLVLPATASAKEITAATVCGANTCNDVKRGDLQIFTDIGDARSGPPDAATPFFRVELTVDGAVADRLDFVPRGELLLAGDKTWYRTPPEMVAAIKRSSYGLEAFPIAAWDGPLAAPATSDVTGSGGDPPYGLIAAILAACVTAGVMTLTLRRRRGTALG